MLNKIRLNSTMSVVAATVGLAGLATPGMASPVPVALTGWNDAAVTTAKPLPTNVAHSTTLSVSSFVFFQQGLTGTSTGGLPTNGMITSAMGSDATFQLQSYTGNDVEIMTDGNNHPLTLTTPEALGAEVQFLSISYGGSSWTATLNFDALSGGGSQTLSSTSTGNWLDNNSNPYAAIVGIVDSSGNQSYGGPVYLYENDLSVPSADQSKLVDSVTFAKTGGTNMSILAMDADATPEPATVGLIALSAVGLLWRRRRCV
jgi:hypothetical protein